MGDCGNSFLSFIISKVTHFYYIINITIKELTMLVRTQEQIEESIARQNENTMKFQAKMWSVLGVIFMGIIIVDGIFF